MSRKWNIPLTHQPKVEPVRHGDCLQTIRIGRKFSVGDLLRFYTWAGRPYHSKRETITEYMKITDAINIDISEWGIIRCYDGKRIVKWGASWGSEGMKYLAKLDGVVPPTGDALLDVLVSKNGKIPEEGVEAQIVRWLQ